MLIYLPVSLFLSRQRQPRFPSLPSTTICRAHKKSWQLEREIEPIDRGRVRGTANARASSCSVEHNASRWMRRAPRYRFSFGRWSTTLSHGPTASWPSSFSLTSHSLIRRCCFSPSRFVRLFVPLLIPGCFWDLLIGNINRMHEERQSRVNKPLKGPSFFLIFGLLLLQCFICLRYEFFLRICKLFFNSLLYFLLIFLFYFSLDKFCSFIHFLHFFVLFYSLFFYRIVWTENYMDRLKWWYQRAISRALINHEPLLFHRAF